MILLLVFHVYLFKWFLIPLGKLIILFNQKSSKNQLVYFESFPSENAGYIYRSQIWAELIAKEEGKSTKVLTIVDNRENYNKLILSPNRYIIRAMWLRYFQLLRYGKAETIIVRRELLRFNDYGNLFFDKFLLRINSNVILDFDDDIAASKQQPKVLTGLPSKILLENGNKFNDTLRLYRKFIVASDYLKEKVIAENPSISSTNILVVPTCVNYPSRAQKDYSSIFKNKKLQIGWVGSSNNFIYLHQLIPVLNNLEQEGCAFEFILISNELPDFLCTQKFKTNFIQWKYKDEIQNLLKIDIGIMPLINTDISKGKGGFKLIQYMGLGIVSVATPITINQDIIDDGINGFFAENEAEWMQILHELLTSKTIDYIEIGANASKKIEQAFSFNAHKLNYINFLKC